MEPERMAESGWVHPAFEKPPVIESAFAVEFAPLHGWKIPYYGLYWESIRSRYPKLDVHSAIPSQIEDLDEQMPSKSVSFGIVSSPPVRCWFYNEPETELIQVQNDRFIFNWKRGVSDERYPHYKNIRPTIKEEWNGFVEFVKSNKLGHLNVMQCEVTYINHIEKGVGWRDYSEFGNVFPQWAGRTVGRFLPVPEDAEFSIRYLMPERRGRLYVRAQPAIRNADLKEIIQLTFVARGRPRSSDSDSVFDWLDASQEYVARSFLDVTTEQMHSLWGMKGTL